jgi:hypothetical protein
VPFSVGSGEASRRRGAGLPCRRECRLMTIWRRRQICGQSEMASYPALRLVDLSGLAAFFFSAPRLPSIGRSISFWPAVAFRAFLPLGAAVSLARLFFSASMRSTTFSPRGRGLAAMVVPLRFALISSVRAAS